MLQQWIMFLWDIEYWDIPMTFQVLKWGGEGRELGLCEVTSYLY
jgi:hypothetical protein